MRLIIALCVISMGCSNSSFSGSGETNPAKNKGNEIKTADAVDDQDDNEVVKDTEEGAVEKNDSESVAPKEEEESDYSTQELSEKAPGCGIPIMHGVPFFGRKPNQVGGYPTSHPVVPSYLWFRHIFSTFEHQSYDYIFESGTLSGLDRGSRVGKGFMIAPSRKAYPVHTPFGSIFNFNESFWGIPSGVKITLKDQHQEVLFTATGPMVIRFIDSDGLSEDEINKWSSTDMMDALKQTLITIGDDPLRLPKWLEGLNGNLERFVVKRIDRANVHSLKISLLDRAKCDIN